MAGREKRNKSRGSSGFNRKRAEDFLNKNKNKDGVIETNSGLQYLIVEEGTGNTPQENAFLSLNQRCQLLDGKILIDTYKENSVEEVKLEELIEGLKEGILLMKKGARFKFFISPELAWGEKGTGNKIPPNAVLIFDIRLVDFW